MPSLLKFEVLEMFAKAVIQTSIQPCLPLSFTGVWATPAPALRSPYKELCAAAHWTRTGSSGMNASLLTWALGTPC